jgi:mannosyltransferase OCH1-like enzyme
MKYIILILILIILCFINAKYNEYFKYIANIEKCIYMTYKTKDVPEYIFSNWKNLYPDYQIKLYDNNDCLEFLKKEFNQEHVDVFNYIQDGPIKADFWRACILYKYGGIYTDIDIKPYISIHDILEKDVIFLTCISMVKNQYNPHFIYCVPGHVVFEKTISKYLEKYLNKEKYDYWSWSIVFIIDNILFEIFKKNINEDGIYYDEDNNKYQFLKEIFPTENNKDHYCKYKDKRILDNRYEKYNNHQF